MTDSSENLKPMGFSTWRDIATMKKSAPDLRDAAFIRCNTRSIVVHALGLAEEAVDLVHFIQRRLGPSEFLDRLLRLLPQGGNIRRMSSEIE